jgi:cytochrome-b5 reductase
MLPLSALVGVLWVLGLVSCAAVIIYIQRTRPFLDPAKFKVAELIEKETVTHNTKRFRFALAGHIRLGLPVGQHVSFKFTDGDGRDVLRSYTPVTGDETRGHVDFVIKIYPKGKMSQHMDGLEIGGTVQMRGPKGRLTYTPNMRSALGERSSRPPASSLPHPRLRLHLSGTAMGGLYARTRDAQQRCCRQPQCS